VFITIPEHHSNGRDAYNGHIALSLKSVILCCSAIPARFKFCKPAFCEVFSGTSCCVYNFAFFLLSFLAFFSVIWIFGFLFPFLFISSLSVVTSHCWVSFKGFKGNTSSLTIYEADILISFMYWFFKPSHVLSTLTTNSLALCFFDLSSYSFISRSIFLAMRSLNSCFFSSVDSFSAFLLIWSFSIQVFPTKRGKGALFSTNLMTSDSSLVNFSWEIIGTLVDIPHSYHISFKHTYPSQWRYHSRRSQNFPSVF